MSADNVAPSKDALQFDRALSLAAPPGASQGVAVVCANCGTTISTEYFHIGGHVVCASCRRVVESSLATPRDGKTFVKAGAFGIGAAIAGAIVYYAVIAITNFEIGIVAILIGYMVGYMVRKGAGGKGGRRFQVLALVLTYWAVGLAYTPLAFKGSKDDTKSTVSADSVHVSKSDSATASVSDSSLTTSDAATSTAKPASAGTKRGVLFGVGALIFLTFALPVLVVFGSLPSGLLSAIIIVIGLRQAWRMTAGLNVTVSGPYKVGANPSRAPA